MDKLTWQVKQGARLWKIRVEDHLEIAGTKNSQEISGIHTSEYFPPEEYDNTGRTLHMPPNYLCMGSLSHDFRLWNGERRALSLVLFHDQTRHRGTSEVNVWMYGWPVGVARPDYTNDLPCHSLRDDLPIEITIAKGTRIERSICLPPSKAAGQKSQ